MYEYVGNLHVHSTHSDGHGSVEEIARAAKSAGLDFVGLADHYHMLKDGIPHEEGGYRDGVLMCVGAEFHGEHSHYLAWGINGLSVPASEADPQATIDAVNAQGGVGFLAHPFDRGTPLHDGGHVFAWRDWAVHDYTGMGIWNFSSEWKRGAQTVPQGVKNLFLLRAADVDPIAEDLARWDELNRERLVVGIGESDNHALPLRALGGLVRVRFLPYRTAFRGVNTHVLLEHTWSGDAPADAAAVYDALRRGRCYVANHQRGDARGFRCVLRVPGTTAHMGDTLPWQPGLRVHAVTGAPGRFRVIADGREAFALRGRSLQWPIPGPGVYRVEVRRRGPLGRERAWIFGNPIRVTA